MANLQSRRSSRLLNFRKSPSPVDSMEGWPCTLIFLQFSRSSFRTFRRKQLKSWQNNIAFDEVTNEIFRIKSTNKIEEKRKSENIFEN